MKQKTQMYSALAGGLMLLGTILVAGLLLFFFVGF
jgi:hypothetical protein